MKVRRKAAVEALQLTWANWSSMCEMLSFVISPSNPARHTDEYTDRCGERAPYMELTIPTVNGIQVAKHGDWIVRDQFGGLHLYEPSVFNAIYEEPSVFNAIYEEAKMSHQLKNLMVASGVQSDLTDTEAMDWAVEEITRLKAALREAAELLEASAEPFDRGCSVIRKALEEAK